MRAGENTLNAEAAAATVLDAATRLSSLSIVIDDFDSAKGQRKELKVGQELNVHSPCSQKPYTRSASDASIKKILEEAENRKHEFWKLIDEHNAVIENLKRIEKLEQNIHCNKMAPSPIRT